MVTMRYSVDMAMWRRPWGIVSDPHGNPEGLAAALDALVDRGAGPLYCLGDAVGYLPYAKETVDLLRSRQVTCISGNHDAMLTASLPLDPDKDRVYQIAEARRTLGPEDLTYIATWPDRIEITGPGGEAILMVHGGIRDPWSEYVRADTDLADYVDCGFTAVFVGHTHRPFVRQAGATTVVNVGSCGLPRDIGNSAASIIYEPWSGAVTIVRSRFDAEALIYGALKSASVHPSVLACLRRRSGAAGGNDGSN